MRKSAYSPRHHAKACVSLAVMSFSLRLGSCQKARPAMITASAAAAGLAKKRRSRRTHRLSSAGAVCVQCAASFTCTRSIRTMPAMETRSRPVSQTRRVCATCRKGLCDTRQDFAMLTDHATHMGEADWDKLFLTDSGLGDEKSSKPANRPAARCTAQWRRQPSSHHHRRRKTI